MYHTVGFAVIDLNKKVLFCSDAFADVMGVDVGAIVGRPVVDITAPEDRDETGRRLDDLISGKVDRTSTQKRYVTPAGHRKWCSLESARYGDLLVSIVFEVHDGEKVDKLERLESTVQALSEAIVKYRGVTVTTNNQSSANNSTTNQGWVIVAIVLAVAAIAGVSIKSEWFNATTPPPQQQPLQQQVDSE